MKVLGDPLKLKIKMISSRGGFFRNISSHVKNLDLGDKNSRDVPKIKKSPENFFGVLFFQKFKKKSKN